MGLIKKIEGYKENFCKKSKFSEKFKNIENKNTIVFIGLIAVFLMVFIFQTSHTENIYATSKKQNVYKTESNNTRENVKNSLHEETEKLKDNKIQEETGQKDLKISIGEKIERETKRNIISIRNGSATRKAYAKNENRNSAIYYTKYNTRVDNYEREDIRSQEISEKFYWPVGSQNITSKYGERIHPILKERKFHRGIDIAEKFGSEVRSAVKGIVTYSGEKGNYGKMVEVTSEKGVVTRYAHLSKISVEEGEIVSQGYILGNVGSTGMSTGPHLHFEIMIDGKPLDPMEFEYHQ